MESTFLVIGGGIAGVSCVETLSYLCPTEKIILLTESAIIKTVVNLVPLGKAISRFDVEEQTAHGHLRPNVKIIVGRLAAINSKDKHIRTVSNVQIRYRWLCLCTGAQPKIIDTPADASPYVLGIRDTESVLQFQRRIQNSKRLAIVGNGGIASEIVYETSDLHIDWIVKDQYIAQTFVDPAASEFFQSRIRNKDTRDRTEKSTIKRMRYDETTTDGGATTTTAATSKSGAALGPDWHRRLNLSGLFTSEAGNHVQIHYGCDVQSVQVQHGTAHPLKVTLSDSDATSVMCDLLVSATGVVPSINFECDQSFGMASDGGILVDDMQRTSIGGIYAAGDICTADWSASEHWFQMRLWTQARQMGTMAARSMNAHNRGEMVYQDFCFELFGHVTELFGYQVVLLGRYKGQGLNNQYEALIRMTRDQEYIKYVIVDGRVKGAILIGETGLEETTENLILNQLDVSPYGDDLLNPDIDIEDYFD